MNENENKENIIEVIDDGPLRITGSITLHDQKRGINTTVNEIYLCRCGRSSNSPYCDESHSKSDK
jgi:CDGSH iron-sulfur domain-containing protein 3